MISKAFGLTVSKLASCKGQTTAKVGVEWVERAIVEFPPDRESIKVAFSSLRSRGRFVNYDFKKI